MEAIRHILPHEITWAIGQNRVVILWDNNYPYERIIRDFKDYGKTWALTKEELESDKK